MRLPFMAVSIGWFSGEKGAEVLEGQIHSKVHTSVSKEEVLKQYIALAELLAPLNSTFISVLLTPEDGETMEVSGIRETRPYD